MIPTRNRAASLERTLQALARQERLPDEVIIVDASEPPLDADAVRAAHGMLPLTVLHARPGVCAQRNLGIRSATGSHVLLCDDDIEPPPDYLRRLTQHLLEHPAEGAVTGTVSESEGHAEFSTPALRHLLFAFVFQHSVWADVEAARSNRLAALPLALLKRWYRQRGNTWSAAGWPLVTQVHGPVFRTATYGLGAALVRRDWLLAAPFDEQLGTHGIGDNYGVALHFPAECGITVLTDLPVLHYRAAENRLDPREAYFQRVLALDYFLRTSGRFSRFNTAWLAWSLLGKAVAALRHDHRMLKPTLRALALIARARNPLLHDSTSRRFAQ